LSLSKRSPVFVGAYTCTCCTPALAGGARECRCRDPARYHPRKGTSYPKGKQFPICDGHMHDYGTTVKLHVGDHRLGPLIPLARIRQDIFPLGRSTVGMNAESTTVLFTTMDVKVLFLDTWMV